MFNKLLITLCVFVLSTPAYASDYDAQNLTPQVYFQDYETFNLENNSQNQVIVESEINENMIINQVPVWPLVGSDADVNVSCDENSLEGCVKGHDNIRIVSTIGDELVIDSDISGMTDGGLVLGGDGWSGGANMMHGRQMPAGFMNECATQAEMPLMAMEMLEDDGGSVLAISRSGRKKCNNPEDDVYYVKQKMAENAKALFPDDVDAEMMVESDTMSDMENTHMVKNQIKSWVVESGSTLRSVLQDWATREGWDLVWATSREYPIEASAVFKGRFTDVASALVRNFGRATPVPYAKFYKGNRVLVISTME